MTLWPGHPPPCVSPHLHHSRLIPTPSIYRSHSRGMLSPVSLLVIAGAWVGVGSISSSAVCETQRAACLADATCNACLSGAPTDFCSQRYPSIFHDGSAGEGAGFDYCEATGATNCCSHETEEISNQCLTTNSAATTYWTCVMEDEGCLIDDMPCFEPVGWTAATLAPTGPDASITPAPSSRDLATPTPAVAPTPAPAETPAIPETVDFASGATRTFGFPRPMMSLVGLVVASLLY